MSNYQQGRQQGRSNKPPLPARLMDYRTVNDRIGAISLDYPGEVCIATTYKMDTPIVGWVLFTATVSRRMDDGSEWIMGTGMAAIPYTVDGETGRQRNPPADAWEKGETAARGRGLVAAGYTSSIESAAELEAAAEKIAEQEAREARERIALAAPDATGEEPTPIATTEARTTRKRAQRATEQREAAAAEPEQKVGIVSAQGETRGATVESAQRKQESLPTTPVEPNIGFDTMIDPDVAPVATASQPIDDPLASFSPGFRKFIEKGFEAVENGMDFDTIKAKFSAAKEKLTDEQVKEAQRQLASIRRLCKERDEAIAKRTAELATAVATELDELTDEELAFMKAS